MDSGHAYHEDVSLKQTAIAVRDTDKVASFLELLEFKAKASELPFSKSDLVVSVGSTPSLGHHSNSYKLENFELHPGNYTFYDRQQLWTGACSNKANVAARVMSTVIGHYEDRNTMLLDAGALALSKDTTPQGGTCEIAGFPELEGIATSQEVTQVQPKDPEETTCPFDELPIGSVVSLLPNHSCLSAACFAEYFVIDDPSCSFSPDEAVVDIWHPVKYFSVKP